MTLEVKVSIAALSAFVLVILGLTIALVVNQQPPRSAPIPAPSSGWVYIPPQNITVTSPGSGGMGILA